MQQTIERALDIFNTQARVEIVPQVTPLEKADRLSARLGCELYFKRDDATGLAGGGNKARKLEYLVADAQQRGADTLVTLGGLQSNHARQTAAAAAKFGLSCHLVLEDVAGAPRGDYLHSGNLLLDKLLGAHIHTLAEGEDLFARGDDLMAALREQGAKPYLVPVGGSSVVGSLGYVRCGIELAKQLADAQVELDQIVLATGSAGTQAGLLAGLVLSGCDVPVLGISVSRTREAQEALVSGLLCELQGFLGLPDTLSQGRVHANGDYFHGYGIATPSMREALECCAQLEGVLLDPVYTGKGMAGLMDLIKRGEIVAGSKVLFLHTGGSQAIPAYADIF
ncbi:MAG: D-cysteine desulfhydrase family protein [Pseudomonadales bacterium]